MTHWVWISRKKWETPHDSPTYFASFLWYIGCGCGGKSLKPHTILPHWMWMSGQKFEIPHHASFRSSRMWQLLANTIPQINANHNISVHAPLYVSISLSPINSISGKGGGGQKTTFCMHSHNMPAFISNNSCNFHTFPSYWCPTLLDIMSPVIPWSLGVFVD